MKQGRPKKPQTVLIQIPVDKIKEVEKILGHSVARNQTPAVKVRVPRTIVAEIREAIYK